MVYTIIILLLHLTVCPALKAMCLPHVYCIVTMCFALTSSCLSMSTPCGSNAVAILSNIIIQALLVHRLFLIHRSFQTLLDYSRPMTSCHVTSQSHALFPFFLYQQFITWHTVADCGSYFITTYNRSRLHEEKKKKKENEKRKTKKTNHTEVKRKERKQIRQKKYKSFQNQFEVTG